MTTATYLTYSTELEAITAATDRGYAVTEPYRSAHTVTTIATRDGAPVMHLRYDTSADARLYPWYWA